jgi:hypothetical protein
MLQCINSMHQRVRSSSVIAREAASVDDGWLGTILGGDRVDSGAVLAGREYIDLPIDASICIN